MFSGIHDSQIEAYSFDSRTAELVFILSPGEGALPNDFSVIFKGVVAHQFIYPLLPSIVFDISEEFTAEELLEREWDNCLNGSHQCGWPGPWAASKDIALKFCHQNELKAYDLDSSYGMYGWILAKSVECKLGPNPSINLMEQG